VPADAAERGTGAPHAPWSARDAPPAIVDSLRLLVQLRWIAIAGQAAALATAAMYGVALPWLPLVAIAGALVAFNVAAAMRVRRARPTSHGEVAVHLAADLAAFTLLIALSGGDANRSSGSTCCTACWSPCCCRGRLPVPAPRRAGVLRDRGRLPVAARAGRRCAASGPAGGRRPPRELRAHGVLTVGFVARIAAMLRHHERLLREAVANASRDECVLRIGALAAGAAHELASPLTTMAVITDEMAHEADPRSCAATPPRSPRRSTRAAAPCRP